MYKVLYTDIEKSVVREKKIDPLGRCSLRIGNHGPCFSTDGDVHGECTSISWDIGVPGSQKKNYTLPRCGAPWCQTCTQPERPGHVNKDVEIPEIIQIGLAGKIGHP